jgi:hypothetical protein
MWEEPFGMVMIEAMAAGCPVITFARGAAPEVVAHGRGGYIVQDVDEMIQYIKKIDNLDRKVVRAYAIQNFSVSTMAEKYLKIYKRVRTSALLEASLPRLSVSDNALTTSRPGRVSTTAKRAISDLPSSAYPSALSAQVTLETEPDILQ